MIYVWLPAVVSFRTVSTYDVINIQAPLLIFLPRIVTFLLDCILICLKRRNERIRGKRERIKREQLFSFLLRRFQK